MLQAPQVSRQSDARGLRTRARFFVTIFRLGSTESSPRPGLLFEHTVIARLSLQLSLNYNALIRKGVRGRAAREKKRKEAEKTNQTKGNTCKMNKMQTWMQKQV